MARASAEDALFSIILLNNFAEVFEMWILEIQPVVVRARVRVRVGVRDRIMVRVMVSVRISVRVRVMIR